MRHFPDAFSNVVSFGAKCDKRNTKEVEGVFKGHLRIAGDDLEGDYSNKDLWKEASKAVELGSIQPNSI